MTVSKAKSQPAIVFDFMGVLFREGRVLSHLLVPMFRPAMPHDEIRRRYRDFVIGEIGSEEFWAGIVSDTGEAERTYLDRFELADGFEIVFDLKKHYQLAVLSEVPAEWGDYLVRKFDLGSVFDVMVLSGQVGVTKPDVRIFDMVLDKLGRDRSYSFIDDNIENLAVASDFGWRTIWMRDHSRHFELPGFNPDVIIDGLGELKSLFVP